MSRQAIEQKLRQSTLLGMSQDLSSLNAIKALEWQEDRLRVSLVFPFSIKGLTHEIQTSIQALLPDVQLECDISGSNKARAVQGGLKRLPQVKNMLAVASAKGGVGKSTTALNLAMALKDLGANVGILDADIYGPSQPCLLGSATQKAQSLQENAVEPVMSHGLQTMSIGYLIDEKSAMVWRGPMVIRALQQLLLQTQWHELDYLILDLPPGTGDVQITLAQKIPVSGAIVVTTPQDLALLDAQRGIEMFNKVGVPVLGVVENMSVHVCSQCGHHEAIFGEGGAQRLAADYQVPLLAKLPLDSRIRTCADNGEPLSISSPDSELLLLYKHMALGILGELSQKPLDYSAKFPKIVTE